MSILRKISYQVQKYNLRNIESLPVHNLIHSENSSDHWQRVTVRDMNVLDLGIGRWGINNILETSPVYFKTKGAKKIVGVDTNDSEVVFFKKYFKENYKDESIFINKYIKHKNEIIELIRDNNIQTVKCDIEGSEINLFNIQIKEMPTVQHLTIEYHSPVLLKKLIQVNNNEWKFTIIDHSIFSAQPHMGVVTLSRAI